MIWYNVNKYTNAGAQYGTGAAYWREKVRTNCKMMFPAALHARIEKFCSALFFFLQLKSRTEEKFCTKMEKVK